MNIFQISLSYQISKLSGKNLHWGKAYSLSIEPTTSCNLGCLECPSGQKKFTRPSGKMSMDLLDKIIEQTGKKLYYVTLYFQGEPLLHQQFTDMVKKLKQGKIIVGTSTNAHFLSKEKSKKIIESGLDRLIISLDGTNQETHSKYRIGGDFELVANNIRGFLEERKKAKSFLPMVELQFIVFKHNEHQIDDIKMLGKKLGVDKVTIKTAQIYEYENGNPLIPSIEKYSRYKKTEDSHYSIGSKLPNSCQRMWKSAVITWDGMVVPCCFDKDATHSFGKIQEDEFNTIWKSKKYDEFRQLILDNRSVIDICKNCSEGIKS